MFLSPVQRKISDLLSTEYKNFSSYKKLNFLFSQSKTVGFYLYGPVGSGKTTIMKNFYNHYNLTQKQFIHYQELLKIFYQKTNNLTHQAEYIAIFAKNYFKNLDILCIDEIEIQDPVNAVIMLEILLTLAKNHTFVVCSSNAHPRDFVLNVVAGYVVEPLINFYNNRFLIINLDSEQDYRMLSINDGQRIIFPKNAINTVKFNELVINLINNHKLYVKEIVNFGRKITFNQTYRDVLITDFEELFEQKFSYTDYISICQHFKTIVINQIPLMHENNQDQIIRFINFIDNVYINNVLLFGLFIDDPLLIYAHLTKIPGFQRAISRIIEISSSKYLSKVGVKRCF